MLKKTKLMFLIIISSCSIVNAVERIYINDEELSVKNDKFYIHQGHNVWINTNSIHRDETGLYTFESNVSRKIGKEKSEYQKSWKCPYCYKYWPIGQKCGNPDCPSKYKT